MNNKELKNLLLLSMAKELADYGYVLNKSLAEFTKKKNEGWFKFQLIFLSRDKGWEINPGMLIRKNLVEDIFHKASFFEAKYHKTTPTIGVTIEKWKNYEKSYRFDLNSESDVSFCLESLLDIFHQIVEPFFQKFTKIPEIERVVNDKSWSYDKEEMFGGPMYRGSLGMILAKLTNNPDYNFFKDKYLGYYKWFADGFYLPEYNAVLDVLDSM